MRVLVLLTAGVAVDAMDLGGLYALTGWASGPDTISGLLWSPAIFVSTAAAGSMRMMIHNCIAFCAFVSLTNLSNLVLDRSLRGPIRHARRLAVYRLERMGKNA